MLEISFPNPTEIASAKQLTVPMPDALPTALQFFPDYQYFALSYEATCC